MIFFLGLLMMRRRRGATLSPAPRGSTFTANFLAAIKTH
jgi:hypothetical protein